MIKMEGMKQSLPNQQKRLRKTTDLSQSGQQFDPQLNLVQPWQHHKDYILLVAFHGYGTLSVTLSDENWLLGIQGQGGQENIWTNGSVKGKVKAVCGSYSTDALRHIVLLAEWVPSFISRGAAHTKRRESSASEGRNYTWNLVSNP